MYIDLICINDLKNIIITIKIENYFKHKILTIFFTR